MWKKSSKAAVENWQETQRRGHLRPAKNFLSVLGRVTKRLSIRRQGNWLSRAMGKDLPKSHPKTT